MADADARLIIELEAKIDKLTSGLNKATTAVFAGASNMEKSLKKADDQWTKLFGSFEPAKAVDNVFSRARLNIIDEGGARLSIFGKALEDLGPAGLAAGAGVAAFAGGLELAEKTGEWAEQLEHLADKLGLTSEVVQRFDYIWVAAGVGIDKGREAIESLNDILGRAQAGILWPAAMKPLQALGFTQESLMQFQDVGQLLDALPARFAKVGDAAEVAAIADKLGIGALVPLLHAGVGGLQELAEKTSSYGVASDQAVEQAARLNKELSTAKQRLSEAAHSIGMDFQPALVGLNNILTGSILLLHDFFNALTRGSSLSGQIGHELDVAGKAQMAAQTLRHGSALDAIGAGAPGSIIFGGQQSTRESLARQKDAEANGALARVNQLMAEQRAASASDDRDAPNRPKLDVAPKAPKAKRERSEDHTDSLTATANEALDTANKDLAQAYKALTGNVNERAEYEIAANNAEAQDLQDKLAEKKKKLLADETIDGRKSDQLQADIEIAQAETEGARVAKETLIKREAIFKAADQGLAFANEIGNYSQQTASIYAGLALTARQRSAIERANLDDEQSRARADLAEKNRQGIVTGAITPDQAAASTAALGNFQTAQNNQFKNDHQTPLQAFQRQTTKDSADVGNALQEVAVKSIQDFNAGLINAIVNFKSMRDVAVSALKDIEAGLLRILLNKAEASLFSLIPGFGATGIGAGGAASAGSSFSGSWSGFAEGGKISGPGTSKSDSILARVSDGEFIVNAEAASKALPLLHAINSGKMPGYARGGLVGSINAMSTAGAARGSAPVQVQYVLNSPVVTQDLINNFNDTNRAHYAGAVTAAVGISRQGLAGQLRSQKLLRD